jgi:peptidoglycan/xylan/chitin deacetylase (PgdA/CDA1 family)
MDRRRAMRTVAAVTLGVAGGCDSAPPPTKSSPAPIARPSSSGAAPTSAAPPSLGALPPEVVSGPRERPNVALTFHGQGDPQQIRSLLSELENGGARVTVLAVGSWLQAQPDMARRILDGGHELGNHTQNHLDISGLAAAKAYDEINSCAQLLTRLTGSIGTWFRPSQTQHSTATIRAQASRVGYRTCLSYDVDSLDYTDPGAPAIVKATLEHVRNGSIVSMHFGHAGTVTAMPQVLDGLHQRGLRAVTMTELMS